jgi:hypothetical protein
MSEKLRGSQPGAMRARLADFRHQRWDQLVGGCLVELSGPWVPAVHGVNNDVGVCWKIGSEGHYLTFSLTTFVVSFPNTSTTFTAILYSPGVS